MSITVASELGNTLRIAGLLSMLMTLAHEKGRLMTPDEVYEAVRFARGRR